MEELQELPGVGPWTAKLAVAMVHPSFPLGPRSDLAARRGLTMLGLGGEEAGKVLEELGDMAGLLLYLAALHYEQVRRRRSRG